MRRSRFAALVGLLIVAVLMVAALPAFADATYRTQHIALQPSQGAPLKAGFVENIHVNGPHIFALERYVLVGAEPSAAYQVTIQIYAGPDCTDYVGPMPTTTVTTNARGNGASRFTLPPQGVPGDFRDHTFYLVWELSADGGVVYETACSTVMLD